MGPPFFSHIFHPVSFHCPEEWRCGPRSPFCLCGTAALQVPEPMVKFGCPGVNRRTRTRWSVVEVIATGREMVIQQRWGFNAQFGVTFHTASLSSPLPSRSLRGSSFALGVTTVSFICMGRRLSSLKYNSPAKVFRLRCCCAAARANR